MIGDDINISAAAQIQELSEPGDARTRGRRGRNDLRFRINPVNDLRGFARERDHLLCVASPEPSVVRFIPDFVGLNAAPISSNKSSYVVLPVRVFRRFGCITRLIDGTFQRSLGGPLWGGSQRKKNLGSMLFGEGYISIQKRKIPLSLSRLELRPGNLRIPQSPTPERNSRPGRHTGGAMNMHAKKILRNALRGRRKLKFSIRSGA